MSVKVSIPRMVFKFDTETPDDAFPGDEDALRAIELIRVPVDIRIDGHVYQIDCKLVATGDLVPE